MTEAIKEKAGRQRLRRLGGRRVAAVAVLTGLALLFVAACGSGAGNDSGRESTAVFQLGSGGSAMNPVTSTNEFDTTVGCIVYEGLTRASSDGQEPALAESWEVSEDGLRYTFHLDEATWHDGEPFTSEDVKYTYENVSIKYGPVWSSTADIFDHVETPDPRTAVVVLKKPYGPFIRQTACDQNGAILPKHVFEGTDPRENEATTSKPIGTGAFSLASFEPGESVEFEANGDYRVEGQPKLDRLVGQIISDPGSALNALRTGEIDYITPVEYKDVEKVRQTEGIEVEEVPSGNGYYGFLNVDNAPLGDAAVRRALYRAVDMDYITDKVFFGTGNAGTSAIPISNWAAPADVDYTQRYAHDPEEAAQELDAAGYPVGGDGTRFALDIVVVSAPPTSRQIAELLKAFWSEIDVKANVVTLDDATAAERVFTKRNFDVTIQGYTTFGDPAIGVSRSYTCKTIGDQYGNPSGYCDDKLDAMFQKAATTADQEERKSQYNEIAQYIADVVPVLPLHEYNTFVATSTDLQIDVGINAYAPVWATASKSG